MKLLSKLRSLQLVPGWRDCWRWWSVQAHLVCTLLAGVLLMVPAMPAELQALIPAEWRAIAIAAWLVLGFLVRVIQQRPPNA